LLKQQEDRREMDSYHEFLALDDFEDECGELEEQ